MRYPFARSSRVVVMALLLPACGGGDFSATGGSGSNHAGADAAVDGSGSGGTTGDSSLPGTGNAGSGGNDSNGGSGSGGRQSGGNGGSAGGDDNAGGSVGSGGGSDEDAGAGGAADAGPSSGGTMNAGGAGNGGLGGAGGGCPDPTTWYVDADQDGYGSTSATFIVKSCSQPQGHYTKVGGDCDDEKRDVHPQLTQQEKKFFGTPYKTATGADSYDYDCSGVETGDPSQPKAAMCSLLTLGGCGGSGYSPGTRAGIGANAYCGSQKVQTCKGSLTCTGTIGQVMTPYACN